MHEGTFEWVEVMAPVDNSTTPASPRSTRKKRSGMWEPVWSWLETLPPGRKQSVKAVEIEDWLQENPEIADDLLKQHSRKHLYHYIRKCFHTVQNRKGGSGGAEDAKEEEEELVVEDTRVVAKKDVHEKQFVVLSSSSNSSAHQIDDSGIRFSDDELQTGQADVSVEFVGDSGAGPSVRAADEGEEQNGSDGQGKDSKMLDVLAVEDSEEEEKEVVKEEVEGKEPDGVTTNLVVVDESIVDLRADGANGGGESCEQDDSAMGATEAKQIELSDEPPADEEKGSKDNDEGDVGAGHSVVGRLMKGKKRTKRHKSKAFEEGPAKKDWLLALLKGTRGEMSSPGTGVVPVAQHMRKKKTQYTVTKKEWVYLAVKNDSFRNGFAWSEQTYCGEPRPDDPEYRRFSQAKLDMVEELVWPLDGWVVRVRQRQDAKTYDAYIEHQTTQMRSAKEIQRYLEQHPKWARESAGTPVVENQRHNRRSRFSAAEAGIAMREARLKDKPAVHYIRHRYDADEVSDDRINWSKVHAEIKRYNCLVALHARLRQYLADYQAVQRTASFDASRSQESESANTESGLAQGMRMGSAPMATSVDDEGPRPKKQRKLGPWPSSEECFIQKECTGAAGPFELGDFRMDREGAGTGAAGVEEESRRGGLGGQHVETKERPSRLRRVRVAGRRLPNLTHSVGPPKQVGGKSDPNKPMMTAWAFCEASAHHPLAMTGADNPGKDESSMPAQGPRREKEARGYAKNVREGSSAWLRAKGMVTEVDARAGTVQNRKSHHQGDQTVCRGRSARSHTVEFLSEREMTGSAGSRLQEVGRSRKRWASLCQGWYTLGKQFAGPGVWAKRRAHRLFLPTWCSYTSSVATAPTALGSAIELQPVQKVLDLRFHPGGEPQLVSGCSAAPNELLLYNLTTGRVNELAGHNCLVQAVEYVPGGDRIVSCGGNIVKVWDSATGECLHSMGPGSDADEGPGGHVKNITAVTVNSFQGNLVVSSGETGDTRLLLWNIASGELISDLNASLRNRHSVIPQVDALQFANPTMLVCGSDSGPGMPAQVQLWDIEVQSQHVTIHAHDSYIMCLDVDKAGEMIVTGAGDGTTGLFDARTKRGIARIPLAQECEVTSVSFSPCGMYFQASCSANFTLVFDMRMMPLNADPQWNPLGRTMTPASQGQRNLRPLHCLSHGNPMPTVQNAGQLPGFVDIGDQGVNDARWFRNSSRLATASGNGSVAIWDVSLGKPCVKTIASHSRSANAIAIAPDDLVFASGGDDQKVVLYQDFSDASRVPWRLSLPVMRPLSHELAGTYD